MIASRHHTQDRAGRKRSLENISGPPRMEVRSHQNKSLPSVGGEQLADRSGLIPGVFGAVGKANNGGNGDSLVRQIVLLQLGDAGVGPEPSATGNNARCPPRLEKFGGASGPVATVVVITQNHDGV